MEFNTCLSVFLCVCQPAQKFTLWIFLFVYAKLFILIDALFLIFTLFYRCTTFVVSISNCHFLCFVWVVNITSLKVDCIQIIHCKNDDAQRWSIMFTYYKLRVFCTYLMLVTFLLVIRVSVPQESITVLFYYSVCNVFFGNY